MICIALLRSLQSHHLYRSSVILVQFSIYRNPALVPFTHNRVQLSDPIKGSTYINASWITNENCTDRDGNIVSTCFLASQAPTLETCPHHIQMIYRNQIDIVVTLTKTDQLDDAGI